MLLLDAETGGGQLLRTALSLSMVTGKAFRMSNIRARRQDRGISHVHLACLAAAKCISGAQVRGGQLRGDWVEFCPTGFTGGSFDFAADCGGSTSLVLQTIIPAMLWSQVSHDVVLRGATHNSMAPTPEYLDHVFLPVLRSIGANVSFKAEALGIYPDGGGRVRVAVHQAGRLGKLELSQRGTLEEVVVGSVGTSRSQLDVMERVLRFVQTLGQCHRVLRRQVVGGSSTNSTVYAKFRNSLGSDMFTAFCGDDSADTGGGEHVVAEMQRYIASGAPVGPELADQLLLYMALRPPSRVVMSEVTDHLRTAVPVIEAFLPVRVSLTPRSRGDVVLEVVCR